MKVALIGATGMLGQDVMAVMAARHRMHPYPEEALDITDAGHVMRAMEALQPDALINCAAYTNVDGCETEQKTAMRVNGDGAGNLAVAAEKVGAKLLHVSTDYVFDGTAKTPYREDDPTGPVTFYGQSKLAGEEAVRGACGRHFIVRTAWLYGAHGNNFVATMLKLAGEKDRLSVVDDQVGSPTWTRDLAEGMCRLIETDAFGTYHATNGGMCSWYDFTREIFRLKDIHTPVEPVTSEQFPRPARRPAFSALDTGKLAALGISFRPWRDALAEYLSEQ